MYVNINFNGFCDAFRKSGRNNQFTYNGLQALYTHLCEEEIETQTAIELDVIALCCSFAEYANIKEYNNDTGSEFESIEELEQETTVIMIDEESFIAEEY